MKARLAILAILVFVLSFSAGHFVFASIPSWENAKFTFEVSGTEGTEFEAFFTHEVKYIIGSRTAETDIQSEITGEGFRFDIVGTKMSGNITSKTPGKNITVTMLFPYAAPQSLEGTDFYFSA
jgi:hypothetical protein